MSLKRILLAGVVTLVVASCSSVPYAQRQAQRQVAYTQAAGAPVNHFTFFLPLWSWEPLGSEQVVVYTKPREAWLLDVPGCTELPYANTIGVTSSIHQVSVNFDRVITGRNQLACAIRQIRPVDMGKLKAAQQEQRQVTAEPRTEQ